MQLISATPVPGKVRRQSGCCKPALLWAGTMWEQSVDYSMPTRTLLVLFAEIQCLTCARVSKQAARVSYACSALL